MKRLSRAVLTAGLVGGGAASGQTPTPAARPVGLPVNPYGSVVRPAASWTPGPPRDHPAADRGEPLTNWVQPAAVAQPQPAPPPKVEPKAPVPPVAPAPAQGPTVPVAAVRSSRSSGGVRQYGLLSETLPQIGHLPGYYATGQLTAESRLVDLIGTRIDVTDRVRVSAPVLTRAGIGVAENESPVPQDRAFVTHNFYRRMPVAVRGVSSVVASTPVGGATGGPVAAAPAPFATFDIGTVDVSLYTLGVERTLLDGRASVGARLPVYHASQRFTATAPFAATPGALPPITTLPPNPGPLGPVAVVPPVIPVPTPPNVPPVLPPPVVVAPSPQAPLVVPGTTAGVAAATGDDDDPLGFQTPVVAGGVVSTAGGQSGWALGDLSLVFKYTLLDDPDAGDLLSAGVVLTLPTGRAIRPEDAYAARDVLFQPFAGWVVSGERWYANAFHAVAVSSDPAAPVWLANDLAVGYRAWAAEGDTWVRGVIPTAEAHVFTPLSRRDPAGAVSATDSVIATGGVHVLVGAGGLLTLGAAVPLTGPRPFEVESLARLNWYY